MPQTLIRTSTGEIIGGTFSSRENAEKAVAAFQKIGFTTSDIQILVRLNDEQPSESNKRVLTENGFSEMHANYYDEAIREGQIMVAVYGVTNAAQVIDIFDQYKAEYNPNGSRNLRDDVIGMSAGAAVGATALGVAGAVLAGPVGAAAGVAAGTVLGGGSGAIVGKEMEHRK